LSSGIVNAVLSHRKKGSTKNKNKKQQQTKQQKVIANYKLTASGRANFCAVWKRGSVEKWKRGKARGE